MGHPAQNLLMLQILADRPHSSAWEIVRTIDECRKIRRLVGVYQPKIPVLLADVVVVRSQNFDVRLQLYLISCAVFLLLVLLSLMLLLL